MRQTESKAILALLGDSPVPLTRREIAQALGLVEIEQKNDLRALLKDMVTQGSIVKQAGQAYALRPPLDDVAILEVTKLTRNGEVIARPVEWNETKDGPVPDIEILGSRKGMAPGVGDRALCRINALGRGLYEAQVIKILGGPMGQVLGVITRHKGGFVLTPTDKKARESFEIIDNDLSGGQAGDLAVGDIISARGHMRKRVRIKEVVGAEDGPKSFSLIALHEAGLKAEFPPAVQHETVGMRVPELGSREDLRQVPLVTIDGADARDFDDAVFAEADGHGFHLIVAIADVSYYVRPGTALDDEAYRRGNSTYFPDRVVPMLPEALSNDLCSLRPHEDRACLAAHMWISGSGKLERYKFVRGLMRSKCRFTYEQVQELYDTRGGDLLEPVIDPLYRAYAVLLRAREQRGALELDIPERKIILNERNEMIGLKPRARLESHKLIEEFMILANVAAAMALEAKQAPCVYRVHDRPSMEKLEGISEFVGSFGLSLPKGQVAKPAQINDLLKKANDLPYGYLVHETLLRAQMQASYSIENIGHFGLALQRYAHFTSPIRRYADLLVHRALVRAYGFGPGGMSDDEEARLEEACEHISGTERISAQAERDTIDRFAAAYLLQHAGAVLHGRIAGVASFGLFVKLDDSGADGLVPIRSLPEDYYIHDDRQHALIGRRNGLVYRLGAQVSVAVVEANLVTGGVILEILGRGADLPGIPLKMPSHISHTRSGERRKPGSGRGRGRGPKGPKSGGKPGKKPGKGPKKPGGKGRKR